MKKYNLDDLKKWPENEPFPEDVNSDAFVQASRLPGNIDVSGMKFYELPKNRFYGTFYAIGDDGTLYGHFEFIKGVCYKWKLIRYFGNSQAWVERFNRNVYKGKKSNNPNGENTNINQPTQSEEKDARRTEQ